MTGVQTCALPISLRFHNSIPRIVATKILGKLTPTAFAGPTAPLRLDAIPEPELPAPDARLTVLFRLWTQPSAVTRHWRAT